MSINSVTISGGLKADPEVRYFESGKVLANFTLATDTYSNGQKDTTWTDCRVWGKAAEVIQEHCKKGSKICLYNARLKQEKWTDRHTQQPRSKHVIEANNVELIGSKLQGQSDDSRPMDQYEDESRRF